jgi:hypothetical protein
MFKVGIHLPEKYREFYEILLERELSHYNQPREKLDIPYLLKGLCESWCKKFKKKFPDLKIKRGFYSGNEHYWCVEPNGTIVDPTFPQFGQIQNPNKYRVFNPETDKIYLGKCMNCGTSIYGLESEGHQRVCKDVIIDGVLEQSCEKELESYYNSNF